MTIICVQLSELIWTVVISSLKVYNLYWKLQLLDALVATSKVLDYLLALFSRLILQCVFILSWVGVCACIHVILYTCAVLLQWSIYVPYVYVYVWIYLHMWKWLICMLQHFDLKSNWIHPKLDFSVLVNYFFYLRTLLVVCIELRMQVVHKWSLNVIIYVCSMCTEFHQFFKIITSSLVGILLEPFIYIRVN
jgi:hypothetical protein